MPRVRVLTHQTVIEIKEYDRLKKIEADYLALMAKPKPAPTKPTKHIKPPKFTKPKGA